MFQNKYDNFRRQTHRLKGFDYSSLGYYFVTICTKNRFNYFGEIKDNEMQLSNIGKIAKQFWQKIPSHFPFIQLDKFIVMPNHIHGIIKIVPVATQHIASLQKQIFAKILLRHHNKFGPQSNNLSSVIRGYKTGVKIFAIKNNIELFWQQRFYDRIIHNENELNHIRQYILNNPRNWLNDRNNLNKFPLII
jgi:REP element-mobilizing transposase RayT